MERTEGPRFQRLALSVLFSLLPAQALCEEPKAAPSAAFSGLSGASELKGYDQGRAFDNTAILPKDLRDAVAVPAGAWRTPAMPPQARGLRTQEPGPAPSPFARLDPQARKALFARLRAERRDALLQAARNALSEAGTESASDLEAADSRLSRLASAYAAGLGLGATREVFFEGLRLRSPHLAYYLARRGEYQVLLFQAMGEDAVPEGARFSPWELALEGGPETALEWSSEEEDGTAFRGLRRYFSNGTVLFEGTNADQAFLSAVDPAGNRVMRAWLRRDAEGRVLESRQTLLHRDTGRKIREAVERTAQALSQVTSFDDEGAVATVETTDARAGTRTVEDRKQGVRVRVDTVKDPETGKISKKASITALKADGAWKSRQGLLDKDGNVEVSRRVLPEGTVVDLLDHGISRWTGADGRLRGHELRLDALLALQGAEREKLALDLARALTAALKMDDSGGRRSRPLSRWLADMFIRGQFSSARLSVDAQGAFTLAYDKAGSGGRVEKAFFGTSTKFAGSLGDALVVMTPISLDPSGKGKVDPRRWREYLADGSLLRWHSLIETRPATFWSNAKAITHVQLIKEEYRSGRWREAAREEKASLVSEAAATSTLGMLSEAIHESWGVGHVLKAGEVTAKTLYTGVVSAGNMGLWGLTGKDTFHLEASGGYASNPAIRALLDDQGFLDRLSPGERAEVERKARKNRAASLSQAGYYKERTDPKVYEEMLSAPYGSDELMAALRNYGAGSYGRRILEKAGDSQGASKAALTAAGSVVSVTENVAETLLNPVIWATFGVGRGVAALKALSAAGIGARFLPAALVPTALAGAQAADIALTGILYGSWAVGGIHNAAQTVQAFREDSDYSDRWLKASDAATDLFFLGMMAKDAWDSRRAEKAMNALDARQKGFAQEAQAALDAIESKQAKAAAPQAGGRMSMQSLMSELPQSPSAPAKALAPKAAPLLKSVKPIAPKERLSPPRRGVMDRLRSLQERFLSGNRAPSKPIELPRVRGAGNNDDKDGGKPADWKIETPGTAPAEKKEQEIMPLRRADSLKVPAATTPGLRIEPDTETAPEQARAGQDIRAPGTLEDPVAEPRVRDSADPAQEPSGGAPGDGDKQGAKGSGGGTSGTSSSGGSMGGSGGGAGGGGAGGASNGDSGGGSFQGSDTPSSPIHRDAALKSGSSRPFDGTPKAAPLTPNQGPAPTKTPLPEAPAAAPASAPVPAGPARTKASAPYRRPAARVAPPFHYFYGKAGEVAGLGAFSPRPAAPAAPQAQARPLPEKAPAPALPMPEKKLSAAPPPQEEYQDPKTTAYLPPARNLDAGRLPEKRESSEKGAGLAYLLQFAALGAGIFLLRYSELPFVLGLVRKPY